MRFLDVGRRSHGLPLPGRLEVEVGHMDGASTKIAEGTVPQPKHIMAAGALPCHGECFSMGFAVYLGDLCDFEIGTIGLLRIGACNRCSLWSSLLM